MRDRIATGLAPLPEIEPGRTGYTIPELALIGNCDPATLYRLAQEGRLPVEMRAGRKVVTVAEAVKFLTYGPPPRVFWSRRDPVTGRFLPKEAPA
jgi:hypothetical protein